ncbi:MAG: hypothetical protein JWQ02_4315 [Capsulimonas sp.]|nr:hypothetical protein [Capsulimonas sp.]
MRTRPHILILATASAIVAVCGPGCASKSHSAAQMGRPMTATERAMVTKAAELMAKKGLKEEATLTTSLLGKGIWRSATDTDIYMKQAEQDGGTPYAYTLSEGKNPSAIVLAPRFFNETTETARASLMLHELGHYRVYVKTGRSDETDGYKAQYDENKKLGMGEESSLPYFAMLDGVVEYVVPKYPEYKNFSDVKGYMNTP